MVFQEAQQDLLARALGDVLRRRAHEVGAVPPGMRPEDVRAPNQAPVLYSSYRGRELEFIGDVLGCRSRETGRLSLWSAQRAIVRSVFENQKTLVRGSRKFGKSFIAACIAHAWLQTRAGRVIVLGPGLDHVRDIFWEKFSKLWNQATRKLAGKLGTLRAEIGPGRSIVAIPTNASPGRVRGYHDDIVVPDDPDDCSAEAIAKFENALETQTLVSASGSEAVELLVIIDEAQEITKEVYRILQGTLSSKRVHIVLFTNPFLGMSDEHEVAHAAKAGSGWHRIAVSHVSEDRIVQMGGVRDPLDCEERFESVPPYFVDKPWVDHMLSRHDISDPLLWSDVFGRLSEGNLSSLVIPRSALLASLTKNPENEGLPLFNGPSIGVDIGLTRDRCIATFLMDGELIATHDWLPGSGDNQAQVSIAKTIMKLAAKWGRAIGKARPDVWDYKVSIPGHRIHIDDSGLTGVADILASMGCTVDRIDFGAAPAGDWREYVGNDVQFANRKAEIFWCLRRLLQEGCVRVGEQWERIYEQAQYVCWEIKTRASTGMVVQIASKDEVREEYGRSPDDLDSLALAAIEPSGGRTFMGRRMDSDEPRPRTFA